MPLSIYWKEVGVNLKLPLHCLDSLLKGGPLLDVVNWGLQQQQQQQQQQKRQSFFIFPYLELPWGVDFISP